jgi:hypothetical protein
MLKGNRKIGGDWQILTGEEWHRERRSSVSLVSEIKILRKYEKEKRKKELFACKFYEEER